MTLCYNTFPKTSNTAATANTSGHSLIGTIATHCELTHTCAAICCAHAVARASSPSFSGPSLSTMKNPSAGMTSVPPRFVRVAAIG
jgi:hypothetical protein